MSTGDSQASRDLLRSRPARGPWPENLLVLLDVEASSLNEAITKISSAVFERASSDDRFAIDEQAWAAASTLLRRRANAGPEFVAHHSVAIIHGQVNVPCRAIDVLVRFARPLEIRDEDDRPTHFLWILLSDRPTHPHIAVAAEFAHLMDDDETREEAIAASSPDELADIYREHLQQQLHFAARVPPELRRHPGLFGGLRADLRRRMPLYGSDYGDGLAPKTLAATIFLYFGCMAPTVAFGGLLAVKTNGALGAIELLVGTTLCGVVYALLSGQPLTIIGTTGPVTVAIATLYQLCERFGLVEQFLSVYALVGLWTMFFLLVLVAIDACGLLRFFTRFTDDAFAALISAIYIVEALSSIVGFFTKGAISPATAKISLLLALGTYIVAKWLSRLRQTAYLRRLAREFFSDFGPAIAIVGMTVVALLLERADLTTLQVPARFGTTTGRPWLVNPFDVPRWVWLASALPAMLMTILLYLDQNITVRLVNSPDNKLRKGAAYNLDMMVLSVLVGVCSIFGAPWTVAATVRSLNHVRALANTTSHQGREFVTSVVETRLSNLGVHVLMGLSLLILPQLARIPMSALFGLFLFMGVASMRGNQMFERLSLWLMDPQSYPTTHYLRAVPLGQVHKYTAIQLACLALLWFVKASALGIVFPLFIGMLVPVRMGIERFFEPEHLALLDADEVPDEEEGFGP